MRLSFGRQIVALSLFGMFALTLTGSIAAAFLINKKLSDSALEQGYQITSTLAHQSVLSLLSELGENVRDEVGATLKNSNVRGVSVFDKHGKLLINAGDKELVSFRGYPGVAAPFEAVLTHNSDEVWEFTASVYDVDLHGTVPDNSIDHLYTEKPELLGYVSVLIDRTKLYKIQSQLLNDSLLIFIGMALVLMVISIAISRQMTMPLHQLAALMKRAENGEDGIRSNIEGPLEVCEMARAFNAMMGALEQRKRYSDEQHLSLLHEIDERQLVERNLRESEHRLVTIFNNVVDGIMILDDAGFVESANPVAESMLEAVVSIVGRHYGEIIRLLVVDQVSPIPTDIHELLEHCTGGCHFSIQKPDGHIDIDVKFSAMQISGNTKYIVIVRDITETQQQKNRIELLLSKHKTVVSSVPGIMMELDRSGRILWFNKHTEDVLGPALLEINEVNIARFVTASELDNLHGSMDATFNLGRSEIHTELVSVDGVIPYQFNMASLTGVIEGDETLLLIGLDDSQSIMAQKALQSARDAALESAKMKSEFLANMSHEIRTPMNGMFGMLQLMLGSGLDDEQKSYAEIALRSADQLLHIINDILDFSKIEAGKLEVLQVEVSPRTLIEDLTELFSQRAYSKGVKLYSKVETDVPDIIYGDPVRLNQIISNLISNAIKFTDEGHVLIQCLVEGNEENSVKDRTLCINVIDTGVGIDSDYQEHIFESFVQVDGSSTRRHSGTGLGLAIVKQLVGLMGGEVFLRSDLNHGSSFTVRLPLLEANDIYKLSAMPVVPEKFYACYVGEDYIAASIVSDYLKPAGYVLDIVNADEIYKDSAILDGYSIYLVDYDPRNYEGIVPHFMGRSARVVVMINQNQKSHTFSYPSDVEFYKLVKPIRYHALHSSLEDRGGKIEAVLPAVRNRPEVVARTARQRVRLLVVEDHEVNLKVIEAMLNKLGYAAMSARNGREAVELMERRPFDIVLMDCQMPVMDGYQATIAIRQGAGRHATIIAMTGNAMEGDRQRCLAAGMDDYIPKPVRLTALADVLTKWAKSERLYPSGTDFDGCP